MIDDFSQLRILRHDAPTAFRDDIQSVLQFHYVLASIADCVLVQAFSDFVVSYHCDLFV